MDKGRDTFVKICFIVDIKEFTIYYYSENTAVQRKYLRHDLN